MKREIKFRAYIHEDNKIYDVLAFNAKFPDEDYYRVFINKERGPGTPANYRMDGKNALMQYTGLKDKNGKELFEGDIIQAYRGGGLKKSKNDICFIKYSDNSFIMASQNDDEKMDCIWFYDYEIIGNIYENPKLTN